MLINGCDDPLHSPQGSTHGGQSAAPTSGPLTEDDKSSGTLPEACRKRKKLRRALQAPAMVFGFKRLPNADIKLSMSLSARLAMARRRLLRTKSFLRLDRNRRSLDRAGLEPALAEKVVDVLSERGIVGLGFDGCRQTA
jgi:hypothetical protein